MDDLGASLPLGTRLYEFEVVRVLGIGGFGITYLAHDTNLGREVAIKEYFPGDFAFRQNTLSITPRSEQHAENFQWGLQRFLEEARILARLNHPSIVRVTRFFEAYDSAYIVMQYIAGRPLSEEIQEKGALSESRVKAIVMALMDGLEQVHEANLLHRDIKPGNVMVQPGGAPVLIDFGAARNISSQHSRTMTAVLTPGYAPIEQYGSRGQQGPWTDIYSLGALAYKCLTGVVPEDATDRFLEDQLQPVSQAASGGIGEPFAHAIDVALNIMGSARPQSISQWRELFEGSQVRLLSTGQEVPSPQGTREQESQGSSDKPRSRGLMPPANLGASGWARSKKFWRFSLFGVLGLLGLVAMFAVVSKENLVLKEDLAKVAQRVITVLGMNEAATFSGGLWGAVTEDAEPNTAIGTVTVTDSDGEDTVRAQTNRPGNYGTFTLETTGAWTYTLDNANDATNALAEGAKKTDEFPIQSADGTPGKVVVTVTGANDAATFSGDLSSAVTEDARKSTASGTVTVTDSDGGDTVRAQADKAGVYGTFTLETTGVWTYTLDNTNGATNALAEGAKKTDEFPIQATDGTPGKVVVTVTGANDAATFSGDLSGKVTEDAQKSTASGTVTVTDLDGEDTVRAQTNRPGSYGTFTLETTGVWTYTLDNANDATNALAEGAKKTDEFPIQSADGTPGKVVVTVTGANDAATFSGDLSSAVTEDARKSTASGTVTVTDSDGEDTVRAQADKAGGYGTFTLETTGVWTYTLDNTNGATNALTEGAKKTDEFPIQAADGTAGQVVITVVGANDAATFSGDLSGKVTEDARENRASGTVTVTDSDGEDTVRAQTNRVGVYGIFTLETTGAWIYRLANTDTNTNALAAGVKETDAFPIQAADGTPGEVVVTVTGANDVPVAEAGNNQVVSSGDLVKLDGRGRDPDSSVLSYAWKQKSGKTVRLADAYRERASFTAPPANWENLALTFTLTVSDGLGEVDSDEVTITIVDINAVDHDRYGYTRLHKAAIRGNVAEAKLLLDAGANVDATDVDEETPLHRAAANDSAEAAKLLLDAGADVNATSESGRTPLHEAARWDSAEVAKLLLDAGADVNATTRQGSTPLSRAVSNGSEKVERLLRRAGARE